MKIKFYNYIVLLIFSMLFWPVLAHATPTLSLEIEKGYYDTVTETWVTGDSSFTLKLIGSKTGGEDKLYGVNLVIAVPGSESTMKTGTVSINGAAINSSDFTCGDPEFDEADTGTDEYPSHGIYPARYALSEVNNENQFNLPDTFSYEVVVSGFSWVHFDAFGYYDTIIGKKKKTAMVTRSEFVPPSHDAEYRENYNSAVVAAEVMAVPEPSTLYLVAAGLLVFLLFKIPDIKKKLQVN